MEKHRSLISLAALGLLVAVLLAPAPAAAAPAGWSPAGWGARVLSAAALELPAPLWRWLAGAGPLLKEGVDMDPNGTPALGGDPEPAAGPEAGVGMDPHGLPNKEGVEMDPNG